MLATLDDSSCVRVAIEHWSSPCDGIFGVIGPVNVSFRLAPVGGLGLQRGVLVRFVGGAAAVKFVVFELAYSLRRCRLPQGSPPGIWTSSTF